MSLYLLHQLTERVKQMELIMNKLEIIEGFNTSDSFIAKYNGITLYVEACRGRMWTTILDVNLNWIASFKRSWHPMPFNASIENPNEKYSEFLMLFNEA